MDGGAGSFVTSGKVPPKAVVPHRAHDGGWRATVLRADYRASGTMPPRGTGSCRGRLVRSARPTTGSSELVLWRSCAKSQSRLNLRTMFACRRFARTALVSCICVALACSGGTAKAPAEPIGRAINVPASPSIERDGTFRGALARPQSRSVETGPVS
jgi:hypothetical protein